MQDQLAVVRNFPKGIFEHCSDLLEAWTLGQRIADDLTIEEVHDRGKIELLPKQLEFGNISCPFPIRFFCFEITLQEVGSDLSHFTPIGTVLLSPQLTGKLFLLHELHHQLVVGPESSSSQFKCDPPITITAFMLNADASDHLSLFEMLLDLTQVLQVIVITASGDMRYDQKHH